MAQKLILVGAGGREHALLWALAPNCQSIIVAPGNAGCRSIEGSNCIVTTDAATSVSSLVELCKREKPDLVVVGPEAPLSDGLAGALEVKKHNYTMYSRATNLFPILCHSQMLYNLQEFHALGQPKPQRGSSRQRHLQRTL